MDRAAIFVDGANMLYTQKSLGWKIDWKRLRDHIASEYKLVSAKYYISYKIPPAEDQKRFHGFLATNGYALRTKILKEIIDKETGDKTFKGNLDIELVVDALTTASHYDVFLLFSGDGDFVSLIKALKALGKKVHAYSTKGFSSIDLVSELGMDFHDLKDIRSSIEHRDQSSIYHNKIKSPVPQKEVVGYSSDKSKLPEIGDQFEAKSLSAGAIKSYGVFLTNPWDVKVLLPISQLGIHEFITDLPAIITNDDIYDVEVINIDTSPVITEVTVKLVDEKMIKELKKRFQELQIKTN